MTKSAVRFDEKENCKTSPYKKKVAKEEQAAKSMKGAQRE